MSICTLIPSPSCALMYMETTRGLGRLKMYVVLPSVLPLYCGYIVVKSRSNIFCTFMCLCPVFRQYLAKSCLHLGRLWFRLLIHPSATIQNTGSSSETCTYNNYSVFSLPTEPSWTSSQRKNKFLVSDPASATCYICFYRGRSGLLQSAFEEVFLQFKEGLTVEQRLWSGKSKP